MGKQTHSPLHMVLLVKRGSPVTQNLIKLQNGQNVIFGSSMT